MDSGGIAIIEMKGKINSYESIKFRWQEDVFMLMGVVIWINWVS